MRFGFKLSVGLAVLCALAIAIGACGGGDDSSSSSGEASSAEPADVSGTVTVWDFVSGSFPNYDPTNDRLIAEFERQYPDVTVDHVPQPFETYEQVYKAAFAAHDGPDVIMMTTGAAGVLSFKKGLEVLNDRVSPELQEEISNWGSATAGFSEEGDHYGVPVGLGGNVFYYNKKLFAKAGLPREFEPKTWDEVREAGEKLKAAGIQPFTGGNKEGYENIWWLAASWPTIEGDAQTLQTQAVELGEGERPYTDAAVAEALGPEFMMQEAGLYPEDRFSTPLFPDGAASFGEERGAMIMGLIGTTAYFGEYNPMLGEKNVGMFVAPGAKYFPLDAEWVWSIPTFAENKEAAWAFIDYMTSAESLGQFVDAGAILPNRKDVPLPADAPEQAHQIIEWGNEPEQFPGSGWTQSSVLFGPLTTEVNEALQGRIPLADAQQAMQETAEKTTP